MKQEKKSYYRDNIRRVLMFYSIVPVACITALGIIGGSFILKWNKEAANRRDNIQVDRNIEDTLNIYNEVMKQVADILEKDNLLSKGATIDSNTQKEIYENYYKGIRLSDEMPYFYIFDKSFNTVLASQEEVPPAMLISNREKWGVFLKLKNNGDMAVRLMPGENREENHILLARLIINKGEKYYICIDFPSDQMAKKIVKGNSQTVVTDRLGWIYVASYSGGRDLLGRFKLAAENEDPKTSEQYVRENGKLYFIHNTSILDGQLRVYSVTGFKNIIRTVIIFSIFIVVVFLMLIFTSWEGARIIADEKTKDIYKIVNAFQKAMQGNFDGRLEVCSDDEFQTIARAYNSMVSGLQKQIDENRETNRLLIESQVKQLTSQFNPHFLFNSLENIKFMCRIDGEIASKMTTDLAKLLRYSITDSQEEVTLEEDIEYTESYLNLLKYRFNRRFKYKISLESRAVDYKVPKLLMQPLIENAVKYGFCEDQALEVTIEGSIQDAVLLLKCTDNGKGMEEDILLRLRETLTKRENSSNHNGIYNIHRRIQLMYGKEYGITIWSEKGKGTGVVISLPAKLGD